MQLRYGQLEQALATLHGVEDEGSLKTFRARIKHFQRIGLVPSAPGKGRQVSYRVADAVHWALCFEMSEFGIAPTLIAKIMEFYGYALITWFTGYKLSKKPYYFVLAADFLSWHLNNDGEVIAGRFTAGIADRDDLSKAIAREDCPRWITVNLTALKRRLGELLQHTWRDDLTAWDLQNVPCAPQPGEATGPANLE